MTLYLRCEKDYLNPARSESSEKFLICEMPFLKYEMGFLRYEMRCLGCERDETEKGVTETEKNVTEAEKDLTEAEKCCLENYYCLEEPVKEVLYRLLLRFEMRCLRKTLVPVIPVK